MNYIPQTFTLEAKLVDICISVSQSVIDIFHYAPIFQKEVSL